MNFRVAAPPTYQDWLASEQKFDCAAWKRRGSHFGRPQGHTGGSQEWFYCTLGPGSKAAVGAASTEPGTAEVEDIVCPPGWNVVVNPSGNPMCDNGTGGQVPPVFKPSTHLVSDLGVVGWSIAISMALVVGAALMHKDVRR